MAKVTKRDKERQTFIKKAIECYQEEYDISDELLPLLIQKVEIALAAAAKQNLAEPKKAPKDVFTCRIDPETYAVDLLHNKRVVETVIFPDTEILLEDSIKYNRKAKLDDVIQIPVSVDVLGRKSAHTFQDTLRQGIKAINLHQLKDKIGEMISARVVKKYNNGDIGLKAYRYDILLPVAEQLPGEEFEINDIVKIYISKIEEGENGTNPKVFISRKSDLLIRRTFEAEVPEIKDGIVDIKGIARDNGIRAKRDAELSEENTEIAKDTDARIKVAVYSKDSDVDPVGACVGQGGVRINAIKQQLGNNEIDIIKYSDDPKEFIANALSPAEVLLVNIVDEEARKCDVTVPEDKLSLAIGSSGQNVRLAAKLTKWHINIVTVNAETKTIIQA